MDDLLKQHKLLADNSHYGAPELHDAICASRNGTACNCPAAAFDHLKPVPTELDAVFDRDGRRWRVSVVTDKFIIATWVDAVLDSHNEPVNDSDVIQVNL